MIIPSSGKQDEGDLRVLNVDYEWVFGTLSLRLSSRSWRRVLRYFMVGLNSNKIASEAGLERREY